eukprot:4425217-Pyramimonas_sp.AAC.1
MRWYPALRAALAVLAAPSEVSTERPNEGVEVTKVTKVTLAEWRGPCLPDVTAPAIWVSDRPR